MYVQSSAHRRLTSQVQVLSYNSLTFLDLIGGHNNSKVINRVLMKIE